MITVRPSLLASLFVILGVMSEAICAGKDPIGVMRRLHQPRWALPMAAWYVVGVLYYAMCFAVVYRMEKSLTGRSTPLTLIGAMMLANGAWNFIFFRPRALRWSFWFYAPYILLVTALICALWSIDRVSATLLIVYSAYLPYALAWSYVVLKLNSPPAEGKTRTI
jgi:tryptophan-rich sensory protein